MTATESMGAVTLRMSVSDVSQVAEARRRLAALARQSGLDETDAGRASIIATEMASNLIKHGGGGALLARPLGGGRPGEVSGIEVMAVDKGRGMADPAQCLRDGFSTAGTPGNGLGAIRRQSTTFDLFSRVGQGTVVLARLWQTGRQPPQAGPRFGVVAVPIDGEEVNGDAWDVAGEWPRLRLAVVDGLGHGPSAALASSAALAALAKASGAPPERLQRVHEAIRHTRGAAAALADLDAESGTLRYCGVGNITGCLVTAGAVRSLVSHNGTIGLQALRFQEFSLPWSAHSLLVLHSDGLTARWDLAAYPGLAGRDPALIAAVLWRDFQRGRDDATVLVVKGP